MYLLTGGPVQVHGHRYYKYLLLKREILLQYHNILVKTKVDLTLSKLKRKLMDA